MYVSNNPLVYSDPTGLREELEIQNGVTYDSQRDQYHAADGSRIKAQTDNSAASNPDAAYNQIEFNTFAQRKVSYYGDQTQSETPGSRSMNDSYYKQPIVNSDVVQSNDEYIALARSIDPNDVQDYQALSDAIYNDNKAAYDDAALTETAKTVNRAVATFGAGLQVSPISSKLLKDNTPKNKTVIGKIKDLKNLKPGENTLLKHLPDQGTPKLNWKQNAGVLRREMGKGLPIRDASVDTQSGELIKYPGSFLNMERNLLKTHDWTYNPSTTLWMP